MARPTDFILELNLNFSCIIGCIVSNIKLVGSSVADRYVPDLLPL